VSPPVLIGVSRCVISARRRRRPLLPPDSRIEFVRSSANTFDASALRSLALPSLSWVSVRASSAALACCSVIISTPLSDAVSIRPMMLIRRCTLPARSEITSELEPGVRDQLRALRHQRPQDRHEFGRRDVLERHDLRDQFVGLVRAHAIEAAGTVLLRGRLGHDLDHAAGLDRGIAVDAQHGQKGVVDFVRLHRRGRHDRDLALHVRADDEVLAGDLRHGRDQHLDVGILEVQRVRAGRIGRRGLRPVRASGRTATGCASAAAAVTRTSIARMPGRMITSLFL
jgi:hypothetical protein